MVFLSNIEQCGCGIQKFPGIFVANDIGRTDHITFQIQYRQVFLCRNRGLICKAKKKINLVGHSKKNFQPISYLGQENKNLNQHKAKTLFLLTLTVSDVQEKQKSEVLGVGSGPKCKAYVRQVRQYGMASGGAGRSFFLCIVDANGVSRDCLHVHFRLFR